MHFKRGDKIVVYFSGFVFKRETYNRGRSMLIINVCCELGMYVFVEMACSQRSMGGWMEKGRDFLVGLGKSCNFAVG